MEIFKDIENSGLLVICLSADCSIEKTRFNFYLPVVVWHSDRSGHNFNYFQYLFNARRRLTSLLFILEVCSLPWSWTGMMASGRQITAYGKLGNKKCDSTCIYRVELGQQDCSCGTDLCIRDHLRTP